MSVPVLKRRSSGWRAKRLQIGDNGSMKIDLSNPDVISDDLSGKWIVLKAKKGLGRLSGDQINEINVLSPDGYGFELKLNKAETKLIINLSPDI